MFENLNLKILNRIHPNLIWYLYAIKSKKIFTKPYFILSFDCDTERDIAVVLDVHSKLCDIGICPVYAIPGELLKKGEKVYRKIFESGAEFINHGGREHTYFDTIYNRHASCFFYDKQVLECLGITAKGWRTPHFGTFQKPENLNFLYGILRKLNYKFSTSTIPEMAYRYDAIYKQNGMIEIPVTGIFSEPFNIMDTWACFAAPDRVKTPYDYVKTSEQLARFSSRHPILINIYGDPSHIHDKPEFFQAMKLLIENSENLDYSKLLEVTHENVRSFS
jgi:hypothetical protein